MDEEKLGEQLRLARSEGGAFLLPQRLLIRLNGADAFRYLHGQVTRDLTRLMPGEALAACILTPKGKLCAPLLIWREGEDFLLESAHQVEEALLARLERYIVADDVSITLERPRQVVHCFGKAALKNSLSDQDGLRINRLGVPGVDHQVGEGDSLSQMSLLDPAVVEALRIESCLPAWGSELNGELLPPEAGLDRTHIDYDRGCYPGQEVISRIKSVGKVNRKLHLLVSAPGGVLHPGQAVMSADGTESGVLTSVSNQFDTGSVLALCFLKRGVEEPLFTFDPLTGLKRDLTISRNSGT